MITRPNPLEDVPEIKLIATELVKACARRGVCLTGFIFAADPPFFMYLGTVNNTGPDLTALHIRLCDMVDEEGREHIHERIKP